MKLHSLAASRTLAGPPFWLCFSRREAAHLGDDMKFPPQRRVRKRPEFQRIARTGRRVTSPHFVWIIARATDDSLPSRLGVTASKKVGNSPRRSRVKRVLRAAFRQLEGCVPAGHDLVVICRADSDAMGLNLVLEEWRASQKRIDKALRQLQAPHDGSERSRGLHPKSR